jgi:predicted transcriptional regulator
MSAYSADHKAEHLLRLSDEVSRIAGTLARLSVKADEMEAEPDELIAPIEIRPDFVMSVIRARRLREAYFEPEFFADPAWDMMLELLYCELTHRRVSVSSLTIAAAVPATTALRWINGMVKKDLFVRRNDPLDGRRVYVELTPKTSEALRRYFDKLRKTLVV